MTETAPKLFPKQVVDGKPTIYSFKTCPFCFKIRALLGSRGINYADVEVDPMKKTELKWSEWTAVPVFVDSDGAAMNESNDILHYIDSKHGTLFPREGENEEQDRWMEYSNKILGKSIVAVIYETYSTSLQALDYVTKIDKFSAKDKMVNKWLGAVAMRMVGKSRAKLFDEAPRPNMKTQLDLMGEAIAENFFGGSAPNGADFANYGILRSMQGLNGFDIVENHTNVWPWYNKMQELSGI